MTSTEPCNTSPIDGSCATHPDNDCSVRPLGPAPARPVAPVTVADVARLPIFGWAWREDGRDLRR